MAFPLLRLFHFLVGRGLFLGDFSVVCGISLGDLSGGGGCVHSGRGKIVSWQNASILALRYTTTLDNSKAFLKACD